MGTSGGPLPAAVRAAKSSSRPTSRIERGVTAILTTSAPRSRIAA